MEQRAKGVTIFFSSHILSDIEVICENVAIIEGGLIRSMGRLEDLLNPARALHEITCRHGKPELLEQLENSGIQVDRLGEYDRLVVEGELQGTLSHLLENGIEIQSVVPKRESLEDLFVKESTRARGEDAA